MFGPAPHPQTLAPNDLSTIAVVLPFPECHIAGITQYGALGGTKYLLCVGTWRLRTLICLSTDQRDCDLKGSISFFFLFVNLLLDLPQY